MPGLRPAIDGGLRPPHPPNNRPPMERIERMERRRRLVDGASRPDNLSLKKTVGVFFLFILYISSFIVEHVDAFDRFGVFFVLDARDLFV